MIQNNNDRKNNNNLTPKKIWFSKLTCNLLTPFTLNFKTSIKDWI